MTIPPITDVVLTLPSAECPTGYTGFKSINVYGLVSRTSFAWPGSTTGCACSNRKIESAGTGKVCGNSQLNDGCQTKQPKDEKLLTIWKGNRVCIKREGSTPIERPKINNGSCPSGFKVCGSICQTSTALCPLTSFYLTTNVTDILFDNKTGKYLLKEREGKEPPIFQFGLSYLQPTVFRYQRYPCRETKKSTLEDSALCEKETGVKDSRFHAFDTISEIQLFAENGVDSIFANDIEMTWNYMREIQWNSTKLSAKQALTVNPNIGHLLNLSTALLLLSITSCLFSCFIYPMVQIFTGKFVEWWCIHFLTYNVLIIVKSFEFCSSNIYVIFTLLGTFKTCLSLINLTVIFVSIMVVASIRSLFDLMATVTTDSTSSYSMLEARLYVYKKVSEWAIVNLVLSVLLNFWALLKLIWVILMIGKAIYRKINADKQRQINASNVEIEMETIPVEEKISSSQSTHMTQQQQQVFVQSTFPVPLQISPNNVDQRVESPIPNQQSVNLVQDKPQMFVNPQQMYQQFPQQLHQNIPLNQQYVQQYIPQQMYQQPITQQPIYRPTSTNIQNQNMNQVYRVSQPTNQQFIQTQNSNRVSEPNQTQSIIKQDQNIQQ